MNQRTFDYIILITLFILFSIGIWQRDFSIVKATYSIKWGFLIFALAYNIIVLRSAKGYFTIELILMFCFIVVVTISTWKSDYLNTEGFFNIIILLIIFLLSFIYKFESYLVFKSLGIVALLLVLSSSLFIFEQSYWGGARFKGLFDNTNSLGSIAVFSSVFCSYLLDKHRNYISASVLAISLITILFTQSRGAMLGLVSAFFIISLTRFSMKNSLVFIFFSSFVYFGFEFLAKMLINFESRDVELSLDIARHEMLINYLDIFQSQPLLGTGLSTDDYGFGRFKSELAYFDILGYSGLIGLIFFLLALIVRCIRFSYGINSLSLYEKYSFAGFFAILVMSIGDGYVSNIGNPLSIFFWLFLGAALKVDYEKYRR
ncbi:O-antigen ligase family protein [Vibrio sp. 10N.222.55.E8]